MDVVRAVRCPGCAQLPRLVLSVWQAFCGNDGCQVLRWDMTRTPEEFRATARPIDLSALEQLGRQLEQAPTPAAGMPGPVAAADDARDEARVRAVLHGLGAWCGPQSGHCAVCRPAG
jgi:hypothetical protein